MATPAETASGAVSFQNLSDKLACIIYLLNTNNMTAAQIAAGAVNFQNLSDKEACIIYLLSTGAGGSSSVQIVTYTSGSPANPSNTASPAIAYDPNGNLPILGWNIGTQSWD
jgi:hypothetical protein